VDHLAYLAWDLVQQGLEEGLDAVAMLKGG
jgi:hypothetical protein